MLIIDTKQCIFVICPTVIWSTSYHPHTLGSRSKCLERRSSESVPVVTGIAALNILCLLVRVRGVLGVLRAVAQDVERVGD